MTTKIPDALIDIIRDLPTHSSAEESTIAHQMGYSDALDDVVALLEAWPNQPSDEEE